MKLSRALAIAASGLDIERGRLRAIARALADRHPAPAESKTRVHRMPEQAAVTDGPDSAWSAVAHAIEASRGLLTRTIDMLK